MQYDDDDWDDRVHKKPHVYTPVLAQFIFPKSVIIMPGTVI